MNFKLLLRLKGYLKAYYYQIVPLIIKDMKLKFRYKAKFLFAILVPFTSFIVPLLIFRTLFNTLGKKSFGIWTPENYIIFILTGIFIVALVKLLAVYGKSLLREKYWKTLPGIFLSPVNIYNLLISKLISELLIFVIPLGIIFILCFIIVKASLLTMLFVLIVYILAALFMASIGLAIGSFRMSIEGGYRVFFLIINVFLIFSCIKYPKEFFPENLQFLIVMNPFYYYWDLIRNILLFGFENVVFNSNFFLHFIIIISLSAIAPVLSVTFFNYVYKKYGLIGY